MPQITSIEPQKKKKDRLNIFLDGQFVFGVDLSAILENKLEVGKKISSEEITKIIAKSEVAKLVDKTLRFVSFRPRSEKEVSDYLIKKISRNENIKYSQAKESPLIRQVIAKLKRYRYLDDLDFARWWLESRLRSKPKGPTILKLELTKKGIAKEIIEQVLSNYPNQTQLAKVAVKKKLKNWRKLSSLEFKKKIYAYLGSRGFDFETIKETFAFFQKKS